MKGGGVGGKKINWELKRERWKMNDRRGGIK